MKRTLAERIDGTEQKGKTEPEDAALFRAAVGEVKPVSGQNRANSQKKPRQPLVRSPEPPPTIPDTLSDSGAENAPDEFLHNGLSRMTLRKLRRGNWPVRDSLDLHGSNSDAARKLLQEFLHGAAQREARCVLVIHGKGLNSREGEAVLRKLSRHWLAQHPQVLAFCDAPPAEGGSGAALVLLKASS
ncbi:MAG: Smr/MutS family protein [Gallionella sp.]|nr:Smr/MutS family protein [Gallionella sp.]MDH4285834.1 Smr/MutS family protein [Gallionella sp.]